MGRARQGVKKREVAGLTKEEKQGKRPNQGINSRKPCVERD